MNKLARTMLKPVVWPTSVKMHAYWDETFDKFINLARYGNDLQTICFENIINEQTFDPVDASALKWLPDAQAYWIDAAQRAILFMDILRKRGDNFLDNIKKGQPPVLTFDYTIIMDGRGLERPVNHDLAQILPDQNAIIDPEKRPIVVIDPRAGHGPGIGGSKQDSEIGMAIKHGHPVYFVLFYPDPEPGQTYEDVKNAQSRFVEKVRERHPKAQEPALIGNCQAGWAVALLSADRPDITGPLVLNGSPLSYWAGVDGQNPMRYRGGLLGGSWLIALLCDLGAGKFDGANLVMNFENLNPANTWWTKQYNVWANVDTEEERYLNFEKWWNAYFSMNADEINFIVNNLFMGNRLEQGQVELDKDRKIDLKQLQDPVLVFASSGDNITPPQQALNWIAKVYGSVDEIKRCGQVIIYRVHQKIGHLGIFVSGKVAQKEHKEFIEHIDNMDYLPPGLYELVIEEGEKIIREEGAEIRITDYVTRFEERDIADILEYDDGFEDEDVFPAVAAVSQKNTALYNTWLAPWVRMASNTATAEMLKWMHPMRASRYLFSSGNPFMQPFRMMAPVVKETRRSRREDNIFTQLEKQTSEHLITMLNTYRDIRDATDEFMFKTIYRNPWLKALDASSPDEAPDAKPRDSEISSEERKKWLDKINKGGIQAGIVRTIVLMAGADRVFDEREFETAAEILRANARFAKITLADFKALAHEQARILQFDEERAVNALRWLLPHQTHRKEVYEMAEQIAMADFQLADEEEVMLAHLKEILQIETDDPDEAPEPETENLSQAPEEQMVDALMASSVHRDQAES